MLDDSARSVAKIGDRTFELLSCISGPETINGYEMVRRAKEENVYSDLEIGHYLMSHYQEIPLKWRRLSIALPAWQHGAVCIYSFILGEPPGPSPFQFIPLTATMMDHTWCLIREIRSEAVSSKQRQWTGHSKVISRVTYELMMLEEIAGRMVELGGSEAEFESLRGLIDHEEQRMFGQRLGRAVYDALNDGRFDGRIEVEIDFECCLHEMLKKAGIHKSFAKCLPRGHSWDERGERTIGLRMVLPKEPVHVSEGFALVDSEGLRIAGPEHQLALAAWLPGLQRYRSICSRGPIDYESGLPSYSLLSANDSGEGRTFHSFTYTDSHPIEENSRHERYYYLGVEI